MYAFKPTITSDDHLLIVGYSGADKNPYNGAYKMPINNITASIDQQHNSDTSTKWTELTAADHWRTALVPSSSPPVVVGGHILMVHQQQILKCMTIRTCHGRRLGHYHLLDQE